ncbi:MAG: molecular chaperone DnaJ [Acidimicrobiaceae bacterium]
MTHYDVLGVAVSASRADIHAAYLALARRHHPDAGGDEVAMRRVNQAWAVLSDTARRRRYDVEHDLLRVPQADVVFADEPDVRRRTAPVSLRVKMFDTFSLLAVMACGALAFLSGLFGMLFTSTELLGFAVFCLFMLGVCTVARVLVAMGVDA